MRGDEVTRSQMSRILKTDNTTVRRWVRDVEFEQCYPRVSLSHFGAFGAHGKPEMSTLINVKRSTSRRKQSKSCAVIPLPIGMVNFVQQSAMLLNEFIVKSPRRLKRRKRLERY